MSAVTVRVVTADRTIHTFPSLAAANAFTASRAAKGGARKPRGSMRADILQLLAEHGPMVSIDIADEIDTGPDTLNGVLRRMVDDCVIAIEGVGAYGRRSYRIEPGGHAELAAIEAGGPSNPRNRLQHQAHLWMTAGRRFCSKDLEAAFGFSRSYAAQRIQAALAEGAIAPAGDPLRNSRSRIQYYQSAQPVSNQE